MIKRIGRLVHVKQRAVDEAAGALAAGQARTELAERALGGAERALAAALERGASAESIADLVDLDAHTRSLRQVVQRAAAERSARRQDEERFRQAVAEARMELRRFELWRARAEANEAAAAGRIGRAAEDDLAARKRRDA